jgi:hypothetical protein
MFKRYLRYSLCLVLMLIALTTSGCYTVLQMRTPTITDQGDDAADVYVSWHDSSSMYMYDSYMYYLTYSSWYTSPWTYWCCEPYWTYPYDWRTYSSEDITSDGGTVAWQKAEQRRGIQTRSTFPSYTPEDQTVTIYRSSEREPKSVKQLRKIGTSTVSTPDRRTGLSTPTPASTGTTGGSTPAVSRQGSSRPAASNSKSTSTTQSSTPTRRRGSQP